ncbi:RND family efflux transporter MFP subunit [Calothrix sp. NIES-3974]|nr:RND family efflux transporter MFP subunit [Calothrix sp. NIES-3974]
MRSNEVEGVSVDQENFLEAELSPREDVDWENHERTEQPEQTAASKVWLKPLVVGIGLGLAIAFGGTRLIGNRPAASTPTATKQEAQANTPPVMTVTLATVESASVTRSLNVSGNITARSLTPVLPQANGLQIKEVRVNVGDYVKQGQILAVLDNSLIQDQILQARAEVESRQADVSSKKANLLSRQAALASSQAAVESSQAQVKQRQADLAQAKARLVEAERNYQRNQKLAADGAVSRQVAETAETNLITAREAVRQAEANIRSAEANLKSAQASVSTAAANVQTARADIGISEANVRSSMARVAQIETQRDQTLVRAPVSGVIAEKLVRVGDVAGVPPQTQVSTVMGGSQKLFSIIQDGQLELQALVPEVQLSQIRVGASVRVTSETKPQEVFQGTVREIEPIINQQRREATVRISLPANTRLKPGMFARAAIDTSTSLGVAVPQKSVQVQPDGNAVVFVPSGDGQPDIGQVKARRVELGDTINGDRIEIKEGLKPGERVVVEGAGYLKDGDRVKIVSK